MRQAGDQFLMRMPPGLRARLQRCAKKNGRSMAAEVIDAIEAHLRNGTILELLDQRLRRVEEMVTRHQGQLVTISHLALSLAKESTSNEARNSSRSRRVDHVAASIGRNAKRSTR